MTTTSAATAFAEVVCIWCASIFRLPDVPRLSWPRYCDRECWQAAKNARNRARDAKRALVPSRVLQCRARNRAWAEKNRNVVNRNPWLHAAPPMPPTLPLVSLDVHVEPRPKYPLQQRNMRGIHGGVTGLLATILDNGFCFPIVTIWDHEAGRFVIVDGFHRYTIAGEGWLELEYVPVVVLDHTLAKRMVATVQFNKARGHHQVDLDAEVIRSLIEQGMTEEQIAEHLGIDLDTVHRYKQVSGVAALFANADWSGAWEMRDDGGDA